MRIFHTSDWHLGHKLMEVDRGVEHDAFLGWLLDQLVASAADALLIAGDIFDVANPSSEAQQRWYGFLAEAGRRCPGLDVVVIGGNHDSPGRLDAPAEALAALNVRVVGGLPRAPGGGVDAARAVIPLHNARGEVGAWVCAVPFLRAGDLPHLPGADEPVVEGVAAIYAAAVAEARRRSQGGQPILAMGHAHLAGCAVSELSERRVLVGNQGALPTSIFPDDLVYVALGHLHRAQQVGSPHIRYSGSPIPLSVPERRYRHQVLSLRLEGEALAEVTPLEIPRSVDVLRIPDEGVAPLADALAAVRALPLAASHDASLNHPLLWVEVALDAPDPTLRAQVEDALHGRAARLLKVMARATGTGEALAEAQPVPDLRALSVEDVFLRCWARTYEAPPEAQVLAALADLVQQAHDEVSA